VTLYLGGKEIQVLYLGLGHTRGDSIIFVPQDRIAYLSELFFAEEFPNSAEGYGASWLRTLDAIEALGADIFVAGHGAIPENPGETRAQLHRMRQIFCRRTRRSPGSDIARGDRRPGCERGEASAIRKAADVYSAERNFREANV
jgi:glyoxylase-like metal-dependent hydrolase (beta-lactamase superfamily II)